MKTRCEFCGRFGARRNVVDRGPDGHGGRLRRTFEECPRCERGRLNHEKETAAERERIRAALDANANITNPSKED